MNLNIISHFSHRSVLLALLITTILSASICEAHSRRGNIDFWDERAIARMKRRILDPQFRTLGQSGLATHIALNARLNYVDEEMIVEEILKREYLSRPVLYAVHQVFKYSARKNNLNEEAVILRLLDMSGELSLGAAEAIAGLARHNRVGNSIYEDKTISLIIAEYPDISFYQGIAIGQIVKFGKEENNLDEEIAIQLILNAFHMGEDEAVAVSEIAKNSRYHNGVDEDELLAEILR